MIVDGEPHQAISCSTECERFCTYILLLLGAATVVSYFLSVFLETDSDLRSDVASSSNTTFIATRRVASEVDYNNQTSGHISTSSDESPLSVILIACFCVAGSVTMISFACCKRGNRVSDSEMYADV
jgi:hypothetical protein